MRTTRYRLFGLEVDSEIALPATPVERVGRADVVIAAGELAPLSDDAPPVWRIDDVVRADLPGARLAVWRDRVVVDPTGDPVAAGASAAAGGLGLVLLRRAIPLLHVSAVAVDGVAIAVSGFSGRGKSTLAAALVAEGATPLCDDAAAVTVHDGVAMLAPGASWLKVTREAAGTAGAGAAPVPMQPERARVYLPTPAADAVPVHRIHLLCHADELPGPAGVDLRGLARMRASKAVFHVIGRRVLSDDPAAFQAARLAVVEAVALRPLARAADLAGVRETARRLIAEVTG